ncbi:hypothetical protein HMI48_00515 [Acidithiobacillus ferrooxidans]|uniref:hypothetical protein n=1 Tax=Acidithiobacillus ferrooxidans TaxID=920 RepID=UPI001C07E4A5|nr:hypothetical protein [Acidithiobacillus ferrooxidans]MBU2772445.1 hypothetical protein [Acidithiobacillus ferrooxidans]
MNEIDIRNQIGTMNPADLRNKVRELNLILNGLRADMDCAMRLRQACQGRLAECTSTYFEVDAAHWDDISPLRSCNSGGVS